MKNALKLGAAAAVVVLTGVIDINLLPAAAGPSIGAPAAVGPSSGPSPSPVSREIPMPGIGLAVALPAGRYYLVQQYWPYGWGVSFEVPSGWLGENERHASVRKGDRGSPSGLVMAVRTIGRAYSDPCHAAAAEARGHYIDFPSSDPGLGHLDRALAHLREQWGDNASSAWSAGFAPDSPTATKATPITIGGLAGRYVEVRTPADLDLSSCDGYQHVLWRDSLGELPGRLYAANAGQVDRLWIVDVADAGLLVIAASSQPGASAEDLAELQAIVNSIEIEYGTGS
jgi:hypothetical protein